MLIHLFDRLTAAEKLSLYGADGHIERRMSHKWNRNLPGARSDSQAIDRWLVLVRRFKAVVSKHHSKGCNRSNIVLLVQNGLDNRMAEIEHMKDAQYDDSGLMFSASGDLSGHTQAIYHHNSNSFHSGGVVGASGDTDLLEGDAQHGREERSYAEQGVLAEMNAIKR